ncbi:hypothetical protein [Pseudonocardia sp. H11422]|uniref:hypothetical protein n=1 Tax=Pseudonocardia sp. H11422 TaxID=2835866 RepID=UPI0020296E58|nr:hypothetical protein [Pseudonocardia sp. H11422]
MPAQVAVQLPDGLGRGAAGARSNRLSSPCGQLAFGGDAGLQRQPAVEDEQPDPLGQRRGGPAPAGGRQSPSR